MALVNRQRRKWPLAAFATSAAAALIAVIVGWSSPAFADATVQINHGNVPTTAKDFANQECDGNLGGGPNDGRDVWVFVLPSNGGAAGDFVSVTAHFDTDSDGTADTTKTITTDQPSAIVDDKGTSKAWIDTPAGWTLIGASAEITGTADKFNLTHTCPSGFMPPPSSSPSASSSPSESPSGSTSPSSSTSPSGSTSPSSSTSPSGSTSPSSSTSPSGSTSPSSSTSASIVPSPSTSPPSPSLPVTGSSLTWVILAGVILVGGGSALIVMARRRRITS